MKFQSNFEGYRNDLAKDLKEKRNESKEDAKVLLSDEKEKDEYKLAKNLKREINNPKLESFNREHISTYFDKIDIADQIPEELKIYLDKIKLIALDTSETEYLGNRKDLFNENLQKQATALLNKLTGNDFSNPKMLNHIIYGYGANHEGNDESWNFNGLDDEIWEGDSRNHRIGGTYFSAGQSKYWSPERGLFIVDPRRPTFKEKMQNLFASQAPIFDEENYQYNHDEPPHITGVRDWVRIDDENVLRCNMTEEEKIRLIDIAMRWDHARPFDGIEIVFDDAKWEDIAKWMIDLPNHTIYKLKDEFLEKQ